MLTFVAEYSVPLGCPDAATILAMFTMLPFVFRRYDKQNYNDKQ